ncbi:MAG: hypothetical protein ACYSOI_05240 [Planctomycetota bacterium]|jgi:hypothetical protein
MTPFTGRIGFTLLTPPVIPAEEHVRIFTEAADGEVPDDMHLITVMQNRGFTAHQVDSACSTCHTKGMPISNEFKPGESLFDHSDVVTLEHPDYYPDGRDLGENYTFTSWRMSACRKAEKLDCMYCAILPAGDSVSRMSRIRRVPRAMRTGRANFRNTPAIRKVLPSVFSVICR